MTKKPDADSDSSASSDNFEAELIASLNREQKSRIAYNLATDLSPTSISRWISTGSRWLDFNISNRENGGLPEGRIIEIFGPPSIGKSHIATHIARATQQAGGICVYMDTENATQIENLQSLGINISKGFIFCEPATVEEVFQVAEKTILKARALKKEVPITIIWDSVAASPPKAELEADYDKDLIGVKARAISKGMRKITNLIGDNRITFVCCNQIRVAIGQTYGDPTVCPGGKSIPFHASVRIKLGAGQQIKDDDDRVIGIHVSAKTIKNKVAYPFREAKFQIHFGEGIQEHEELFDFLRIQCEKFVKECPNKNITGIPINKCHMVFVGGKGAWKNFAVTNYKTGEVLHEAKFYKKKFYEILNNSVYKPFIDKLLNNTMIIKKNNSVIDFLNIDHESLVEVKAVNDLIKEVTKCDT